MRAPPAEEGIGVVVLDNPPVNGLGHGVRSGVAEALRTAAGDPAVRAVVIIGANGTFSGGADIREFNTPAATAAPTLRDLITLAEASPKPVVAALGGACMGGGLELALGCHFRVALADARVALPEVKLGLIPGAGGTQRLPRAVGVARALDMIVSGDAVAARELEGAGLIDAVIEGDLRAGAIAFARAVLDGARPARRLRDATLDPAGTGALFEAARARAAASNPHLRAPLRCIDALEAAASLPFEQGLLAERAIFTELLESAQSRALRHAFFAERAAAKVPDLSVDTPVRPIRRVAVVGAGTMGTGIAMSFANAGLPVTLLEASPAALERGMAAIRRAYAGSVERGKLAPAALEARLALVSAARSSAALADADLVVEAVYEEMAVKEAVFRELDAATRPGTILATNTSTLDVDRIAASTGRPGDVLGLHFFSPAHVMKLLEVVRGGATSPGTLATALQLARRIGKTAVVSGVCDGFIGNRMLEQYLRQALYLVEEGAAPAEVDGALEAFGMAMGPFRMSDLAGNDIGWAIRKRRYADHAGASYPRLADRLCEQGRFGQKAGRGWYRYAAGSRAALPDPEVEALVAEHRDGLGLAPRAIGADEIVERCVYALVNEGAQLLDEGIAARASDIDVVYLAGYGFPRHRGGPMMHADLTGLAAVAARMREFAAGRHGDAAFWQPAPRLARLAAAGGRFNG